MKTIFIKLNKYSQAKLWLDTARMREEKKLALQRVVGPQEQVLLKIPPLLQVNLSP